LDDPESQLGGFPLELFDLYLPVLRLVGSLFAERRVNRAAAVQRDSGFGVGTELKAPGPSIEINTYRGSLRGHLCKLVAIALRTDSVPEDAQTNARENLPALRTQRSAASSKPGLETSLETRAHLNESLVRIDDTLKGHMQLSAF
jgi:hypothetical protein